jgi:large subunit ribosomal protein L9
MKLVLRKEVKGLGAPGDVVDVKPGYARNFLMPKAIAYAATDAAVKRVESEKKKAAALREKEIEEAKALADKISAVSLTVPVETGEDDKMFGSVTSIDIAKALGEEGYEIERHDILLEEPAKELGVYTIKIRLLKEVFAEVKVWVVKK